MKRIPSLAPPRVAIHGVKQGFPVRRIYCVGLNYAAHAREMGSNSSRNLPFFFSKPADAVVPSGSVLPYPRRTALVDHEVEMVVALGDGGADLTALQAMAAIFGWAAGLDLTRRDLQKEAKLAGRPWDMAKGFDSSAPIGPLVPGMPPAVGPIELRIGGTLRQQGDVADMLWTVPEIIATLSTFVVLAPGDLILTGTPAGVGPILVGDTVVGTVAGAPPVTISYRA